MKRILKRSNYPVADDDFIANSFILGNGHIGYKGTMDEDESTNKVTLNVIGVYDRFRDKWRESLCLFNPLYLRVYEKGEPLLWEKSLKHTVTLDITKGLFRRKSEFPDISISSLRFVSAAQNTLLCSAVTITAHKDTEVMVKSGIDTDVFEINGPHYRTKETAQSGALLTARGLTNEGTEVLVSLKETCSEVTTSKVVEENGKILNAYLFKLRKGTSVTITKTASEHIAGFDQNVSTDTLSFANLLKEHEKAFAKKFRSARISIKDGKDDNAEFITNYSIYQLLILANHDFITSIPARGLSGAVYKGAVFWDTEIFMLPFFLMVDEKESRNLLCYRINGLKGALEKSKGFGFKGAFYAWESQEYGREACSLYNVTDAKTGQPIRTYFADKQIHISADVLYGFIRYIEKMQDFSILFEGGYEVFAAVMRFYISFAKLGSDGKNHFLDVVGPDEYHERIDDNAFTNYHVYFTGKKFLEYAAKSPSPALTHALEKYGLTIVNIASFLDSIYLPQPNKVGVIEQFRGYFGLRDTTVAEVRSHMNDKRQYLGGLAKDTQIIKQADVITLLGLYPDCFSPSVLKANYEYYAPRTEHGSSLSSSMHSLVAARIGKEDEAYRFFLKSASIDLSKDQKMYAGTIFIGGTHPASNAGAYNAIVYGFLGCTAKDGRLSFNPRFPPAISAVTITYLDHGVSKRRTFRND